MAEPQEGDDVVLYRVGPEEHRFLLVALPHRSNVIVLRFDKESGALIYTNTPDTDTFPNKASAERYLNSQGNVKVVGSGVAVLGYIVIGNTGLLLLVEKARVSAHLPGDVKINTVTSARWHRISCKADLEADSQSEVAVNFEMLENRIGKIVDFPVNGAHWYCESADVTRPFPSQYPPTTPSWQFTWNAWLTESFRSANLHDCCPALMEGTAESKDLFDGLGDPFKLVLLSRRTRLNPGTRYIARGLNDLCEPGNEIECEQIVWRPEKEGSGRVLWNRYAWRRGTVPIRWSVNLKNSGLGEAEIVIRKHMTFAGCKRYVRRLQKRFVPRPDIEAKLCGDDKKQTSDGRFPIVFVSLLRKGLPDKSRSETNLAAAFDRALASLRKMHQLNTIYYTLDWHEMDKQLGTIGLIEAFWSTMRGVLEQHDISSGYYSTEEPANDDVPTTRWRGLQSMHWTSQQKGLARYNCADSLDRTNVASYFICVQVFVEQCRRLKLAVLMQDEKKETPVASPSKPSLRERLFKGILPGGSFTATSPGPLYKQQWPSMNQTRRMQHVKRSTLPVGWEAKIDTRNGRTYYIDHVHKRTSWTLPDDTTLDLDQDNIDGLGSKKSFRTRCKEEISGLQPWSMLSSTVDQFKTRVLPEALSGIADVFLQNGDRNAFFYTGSQAMHSDKIMIFEPENSKLKKNTIGGASNTFIAVARRYNNVVKDSDRQAQIELFLGVNLEKHLSLSSPDGKDMKSLNIVYVPQRLELDVADTDDEDDPLNFVTYPPSKKSLTPSDDMIETRRSRSSPNLASYEYQESVEQIASVVDLIDKPFQMSSLDDTGDVVEEKRVEKAASQGQLSGLHETTVVDDPLFNS